MRWNWLKGFQPTPSPTSIFPKSVAFSVLDLDARLAFRSATSISFQVEWNAHDHEGKFRKGWIDVHYPCEDWRGENSIRAHVRISLNEPYPDLESKRAILDAVFRTLNIPIDVPYNALFFTETMSCEVVNDPNAFFCYIPTMATTASLMTAEELLALPDDGIDRELIRGELREYPLITRGVPHCLAMTTLSHLLIDWLQRQPQPRGRLYAGGIGVLVRRNPDTFVGIDLAYIPADLAAQTAKHARFIDGLPLLAVEITSPNDTAESMAEKVGEYLGAGVPLVWEVNPFYESVTVHRPGLPPELFNVTHDLTAEPHLPGFRVPVAEVFAS